MEVAIHRVVIVDYVLTGAPYPEPSSVEYVEPWEVSAATDYLAAPEPYAGMGLDEYIRRYPQVVGRRRGITVERATSVLDALKVAMKSSFELTANGAATSRREKRAEK